MEIDCTIAEPVSSTDSKRYITLDVGIHSEYVTRVHTFKTLPVKHLMDPLTGTLLRVKVPFRYNRVMCEVTGAKTVQELVKGDPVHVTLTYCGWWTTGEYGGPSWKLKALRAK